MTRQFTYNIGYRGGSGGFLLLHFLLLSEQYYTNVFDNIDLSEVVAKQWNIVDHREWKKTEFWPNNFKSINGNSTLNKIAYFCNPTVEEFFQKKDSTDMVSNWYSNIKDHSWPAISSLNDLINLPKSIYDEMYTTLDCKNMLKYLTELNTKFVWLYTDFDSQNELAYYKKAYFYHNRPKKEKIQDFESHTELWNSISVDQHAVHFLNHSSIQIKLQDLVNTPELLIDHGMIDRVNQPQTDLLRRWKKLHPPEILKKIGIKQL